MAHDVFISHASMDKAVADAVCASLEKENIRCWIAPRDIHSGESWAEAINQAIKGSKIFVLIFSEKSNQSRQVANELTLAVNSEVTIVPFKIDNILPSGVMEYYLVGTHWLDAINPPTRVQLNALVQTVRNILDKNSEKVITTAAAEGLQEPAQQKSPRKRKGFFLLAGGAALILLLIAGVAVGTDYLQGIFGKSNTEESLAQTVELANGDFDNNGPVLADNEIEEAYEKPTNYIESIDAMVSELKFYETGDDYIEIEDRVYKNRFSKDESRFIGWELLLVHPQPKERTYFDIRYIYYRPDGFVLGYNLAESYIDVGWDNSYHQLAWGWGEPGYWQPGVFYVELVVDNIVVASDEFEIY